MTALVALAACSVALVIASSAVFRRRQRWPLARSWVLWLFPLGQAGLLAFLFSYEVAFGLPAAVFGLTALVAVLCCVANRFLFKALRSAEDEGLAAERVRLLEEQMDLQRVHLERLGAEAAEAADLRVRIASDLQRARDLLIDGKNAEALVALRQSVDVAGAPAGHWCEHRSVDALLAVKMGACREAGIRATCEADVPDDMALPSVDVCAVFANLIDNAMRACERAGEDGRFVDVRATVRSGYLAVAVTNGCAEEGEGAVVRRGSGLSRHGWGFAILHAIADRYEGSFETKRGRGEFHATMVLKLPSTP